MCFLQVAVKVEDAEVAQESEEAEVLTVKPEPQDSGKAGLLTAKVEPKVSNPVLAPSPKQRAVPFSGCPN